MEQRILLYGAKSQCPDSWFNVRLRKKEMGVKAIIYDTSDFDTVLKEINAVYKDAHGKKPEQFAFHNEKK